MANEITGHLSLRVNNGNFTDTIFESFSIDQNDVGGGKPGTVSAALTPSVTTVTLTDITLPGVILMKNLDTTNTVSFGPPNGAGVYDMGRMKPGEIAFFNLNASGNSFRLQSLSGAAAKVRILAFEA